MTRIYSKSVRELFKEFVDSFVPPRPEGFGIFPRKPLADGGYFTREEIVRWFAKNYPKIKQGTVKAHLIIMSTNAPGRVHHHLRPNRADDLLFQISRKSFRLYNEGKDPSPIYKQDPAVPPEEDEEELLEASTEFAYEDDLRNYLAKNLSLIEPGLSLYEDEEDGIRGIQFPVGGRFIDILAVSSKGDLVVIELKVSRGHERVVGQLARYLGWVRKNLADAGQKVRGVIVARQISQDLELACSELPHVRLFEYQLSVSLEPVALES
jgi:hypothetical protein